MQKGKVGIEQRVRPKVCRGLTGVQAGGRGEHATDVKTF